MTKMMLIHRTHIGRDQNRSTFFKFFLKNFAQQIQTLCESGFENCLLELACNLFFDVCYFPQKMCCKFALGWEYTAGAELLTRKAGRLVFVLKNFIEEY